MQDTDRDYLTDMLDSAGYAMQLAGSNEVTAIAADRIKFAALCYFIQTVGEAANGVSARMQSDLSDIPWQKIIGMRHRLVHRYRTVAVDLVIGTLRDDLPQLILSLRRALEDKPG